MINISMVVQPRPIRPTFGTNNGARSCGGKKHGSDDDQCRDVRGTNDVVDVRTPASANVDFPLSDDNKDVLDAAIFYT
jgi:hypothetical protein